MAGNPSGSDAAETKGVEVGESFLRRLYEQARKLEEMRLITLVEVQGGPEKLLDVADWTASTITTGGICSRVVSMMQRKC
jgi:hypothetical protein